MGDAGPGAGNGGSGIEPSCATALPRADLVGAHWNMAAAKIRFFDFVFLISGQQRENGTDFENT